MLNSTFVSSGTLDGIIHSMMDRSRRKLIYASLKANALVAWAFANDNVETETGGASITNPLILGRNPNVTSYQYYDELPLAATNEFNTIGYGWARTAGSLIISDQEVDENTGEGMLFKLLEKKMDVLETSIQEMFAQWLWGVGSGTDPIGLPALIPDDPTTGTLGGLSRAAEPQWRTSAYQFSGGIDATNIEEVFDDVLLDLKQKSDKPDIIMIGRNLWRTYRQAVRDKFTLPLSGAGGGASKMFDLGFKGVSHEGVPIVYDEDCGVNRAYFINSNYIKMHILRNVNMRVKELTAPWTVDARGRRVVWQGNFCLWKAYRTHAVVRNGTTG